MTDLISREKLKDDIAVLLERNGKLIDEWLANCIDDVIDEHHACLVAVDDYPLAFGVAAYNCQTICVWVCCNDKVCIEFGSQFHSKCHGFGILGIWRNNCGEVSVYYHLLGYNIDILESPASQA